MAPEMQVLQVELSKYAVQRGMAVKHCILFGDKTFLSHKAQFILSEYLRQSGIGVAQAFCPVVNTLGDLQAKHWLFLLSTAEYLIQLSMILVLQKRPPSLGSFGAEQDKHDCPLGEYSSQPKMTGPQAVFPRINFRVAIQATQKKSLTTEV